MTKKFIVFCEYTHCCGKQRVVIGETDSKPQAQAWVRQQEKQGSRPRLEANDLVLTCPVNHCPAKRQSPRFDFYQQSFN